MATKYPQYLLDSAFAVDGDKTIPPALAQYAGTGRFSQEKGWQEVNQLPINEGGIPPYRTDFNGAFYMLSQLLLWVQQGGIFEYSASLDYEVGNEVMLNGVKYRCVKENGASSETVVPGSNREYWRNIDVTVPAGAVVPFANVTLGGDENRNPIFVGTTQADTGWVLCDGGSDGSGGLTPNLIDRFIRGSTVANNGTTGGSDSTSVSGLSVTGSVGATTLTTSQIPSHTHTVTCGSAGSHNHYSVDDHHYQSFDRQTSRQNNDFIDMYYGDDGNYNDSRHEAYTSTDGAHTHTMTVASTGGGSSHTHSLTISSASGSVDTVPAYYCLAYFMKLPE